MSMCFKDKTFCASPYCHNECGRKMTNEEYRQWWESGESTYIPISYAYFCGDDDSARPSGDGVIRIDFNE